MNVRMTRKRKRRRKKRRKSRGGCCASIVSDVKCLNKLNVNDVNIILYRYSSQFNPDLAKQNKLDPKRKYWLE